MKLAKSTKIVLISTFILFIGQLAVSAGLSATSKNISEMKKRRMQLLKENEAVQQKTASASALSTIKAKAKKLGLKRKAPVQFLESSIYMVQR